MEAPAQDKEPVETPHWAITQVDDFGFAIYPLAAWLRMRFVSDTGTAETEEVA